MELAWDNAGKRTGSSNHENPHNVDLAKGAADKAGNHNSGLVLPVAAPEALRADRALLSTVRHELLDTAREPPPAVPTTRPIVGGIDLGKTDQHRAT